MKNKAVFLLLPFILLVDGYFGSADAATKEVVAKNKAIVACDDLSKGEAKSWSMWAAGQGLTKSDIKGFVFNMCISGLSTAMDSERKSDIDEWQIAMFNRNSSLGLGPLNVSAVQKSTQIAKSYYAEVKQKSSNGSGE